MNAGNKCELRVIPKKNKKTTTFIDSIKSGRYILGIVLITSPFTLEKAMTPKRGQPPKPPAEKRKKYSVHLSPNEISDVEAARDIEAPEQRLGGFIRDAAVKYSREVIEESTKKNNEE